VKPKVVVANTVAVVIAADLRLLMVVVALPQYGQNGNTFYPYLNSAIFS